MSDQEGEIDGGASNVVNIREPLTSRLGNPAAIVAGILNSPKMQQQWEARHKSRAAENPAAIRAQEIHGFLEGQSDWKAVLAEKPEHLKMMQDFVAYERGALSSRIFAFAAGKKLKKVKTGLDVVAAELNSVLPPEFLPRTEDLPKDMQELLQIEKMHTAQNPFKPVRDSAGFLWNFLKYMDKEAWEHRYTAAPMGILMAGVTYLMMSASGPQSQALTYEDTIVKSCGAADILAGRSGDACQETVSMAMPEQFQGCHTHFTKALGVDCTKIATFGEEAKGTLMKGYDANLNRHDETIGNPVQKALQSIEYIGLDAADDPEVARQAYRQTLTATIDNTVENINKYDVYENLVLHGGILFLIGGLSANALARGRRPTKEGLKATWNRAGDLALRLKNNAPLSSLSAFAGGYSASTNYFWQGDVLTGNLNPDVVLYALAAGFAGSTIEKAARYIKREDHMEAMVVDVKNQLIALSKTHSLNLDVPEITHKKSLARSAFYKTSAAAATYAAIQLDFMMTNGQLTAQTLGTATPTALFLLSNPVTDLIAHKVFAAAGGVAGVGIGGVSRGLYVGGRNSAAYLSRKDIIKTDIQPVSFFDTSAKKHHHCDHDHEKGLSQAIFEPVIDVYTKNWKKAFPLDQDDIYSRQRFAEAQSHLKERFEAYNLPFEEIAFDERNRVNTMIETAIPAHSKTSVLVPANS